MLTIQCDKCKQTFNVDGYTTPDTWDEPGEVITELELIDETESLCDCLIDGETFTVLDESHETFDDDVI